MLLDYTQGTLVASHILQNTTHNRTLCFLSLNPNPKPNPNYHPNPTSTSPKSPMKQFLQQKLFGSPQLPLSVISHLEALQGLTADSSALECLAGIPSSL